MRFYHTANASRAVTLPSGDRILFDVYRMFAGAWNGVVAVEDEKTIAGLDELTQKPKSGITSITEQEFKDALKKKAVAPSLKALPASPKPPPPRLAINDRVGRLAEEVKNSPAQPEPGTAPVPKVFENANAALKTGKIQMADFSKIATTKPSAKEKGEAA